jgi:aminopeptidase N
MRDPVPQLVRLEDYTPPAYLIPEVELDFDIGDAFTRVRSRLSVERNQLAGGARAPLVLDGEGLVLESVAIDGRVLSSSEFAAAAARLTVPEVPARFVLETVSRIEPASNTKLMGLYASKDGLFTQCEAEGFRRITWFPDRPDVMSRYQVTIHAERDRYPLLLSNGNCIARGDEAGDPARHWARWTDPFPKPCYLFALVAAKLDVLEDSYTTLSGRKARLAVYVEPGKLGQAGFAIQALKRAMKWDEDVFGLELDLDQYMIVAVGDFNMGAMENKGLNIFNTKYVLADAHTATDSDYMNIDRVVAHEYFHNWTGNRVTCRDWFQLSLKEGLTVFRDQEFGADTYSRPVQRIQEVRGLRAAQFPEDAGPMAHPVRPQSYMEISNFYTATVYEKGAEVVRMIHTLLGADGFRKGMDLYFARHDGRAVTCDDFVQAMADASGADLGQFRRWYDQAGTPVVEVSGTYDAGLHRFTLDIRQSTPATPGQPEKQPLHIPLALGLVDKEGRDIPLRLEGEPASNAAANRVISLRQARERLVFVDVPEAPVPSLLRDFSAPVVLRYDYSDAQLTHLMARDPDPFNRWEAGQRLALRILLAAVAEIKAGRAPAAPSGFIAAFSEALARGRQDPAFAAEALGLPSEGYVGEQLAEVDPEAILQARVGLRRALAQALRAELLAAYRELHVPGPYSPDAASAGRRALRNLCLGYLMELDDAELRALCSAQLAQADNMTDTIAALAALSNCDCPERPAALEAFYARWRHEPLVVDKWLAVQAGSRLPGTLGEVRRLMAHPAFDIRNPNKIYALIRAFCANQARFHASDGSGYEFAADRVLEIDALNPQVAARIARAFDRWRKFDAPRQARSRTALERLRDSRGLSKDTAEIVLRALA